ncbi:MFS multidrug transporter [Blastomyces gilchristii SLH14081]|uniref:MFS multidrug transporter n=1 Tax=Blastomyces gilchristii (strain SLH14081) TaxID=559298 RepID=A0A179UEZ8_BLAGS|nr:MFS multidrug transporter [Blastomyces gilchristii SLH14081]OAT05858.1 MFS multidrug transporter [Blastomyces gilchristii SLH14081]
MSADASLAHSERTPLLGNEAAIENGSGDAGTQDSNRPDDSDVPLADELTTKQLLMVLSSVWVGSFFAALDGTIVGTIAAPISSSFNSLSLLSWLATAYLAANAACQPLSGKLTDIFSRRTGLIVSNILFGVGNLICGLAKDEWVMIFGRTVAGMGGGGITAISTFISSDLVPLRKRGVWQGIGNLCYGLGSALGGVFGGWMNDNWGWRWAFLIQVPCIALATILAVWNVNIPVKVSDKSRLKRIDFLGAGTLVTALVLLLVALNCGGNQVPWNHPLIWTTLPLSGVFLVLFIYVEEKVATEPVIPVRLLLDPTVLSACLTNWFSTMAVFAVLFYAPFYFQVQGYSATMAGLRLAPQAVGTAMGSLGSGILMRVTGRYLYFNYAATGLIVLSSALMTTYTLTTPPWQPFVHIFIFGLGYGSMLTVTLVALIAAVEHKHQAVVTSASYAFRSTGSSIGVTTASAVFQNLLRSGLWSRFGDREDAAKIIKKVRDSLDAIDKIPADWRPGVLDAYMDALKGVFGAMLGLAVLGVLACVFMKEHKLHMNLARK